MLMNGIWAAPAGAAGVPRLSIKSFEQLPQPLPKPYDEIADANQLLAAARSRALREQKLLLVDLGGNWCPYCRRLAGTLDLPQVKSFVGRHYVLTMIDVGYLDDNMHIPAQYGLEGLSGVPTLLVIDPKRNRLLNRLHTNLFADLEKSTPQGVVDWLARWVRPGGVGQRGKAPGKRVPVHPPRGGIGVNRQ